MQRSKRYRKALIELLKDPDNNIRRKAVKVLSASATSDNQTVDALINVHLNDKDSHVRNEAAIALAKLGWIPRTNEEWLNFSFGIVSTSNKWEILRVLETRDDIIDFLSKLNTSQAIQCLIDIFKIVADASETVHELEDRRRFRQIADKVKKCLTALGASHLDTLIKKWLELEIPVSSDFLYGLDGLLVIIEEIVANKPFLLEKIDKKYLIALVEKIVLRLSKHDVWCSEAEKLVRMLISKFSTEEYVTIFDKYINDPDGRVKKIAIRCLTRKEETTTKLLIEKYRCATDLDTKLLIIWALGNVGNESAVTFLIDVIKSKETEEPLKDEAITSLGKLRSNKAIPALAELIHDRSNKRTSIIKALFNIGTHEVIGPLINALKDDWYAPLVLEKLAESKNLQLPADTLIPLLNNKNRKIRKLAGTILANYGYSPRELNEKALYAIAREQWQDLKMLIHEHGASLVQLLIPFVNSKDLEVSEQIVQALTIIKDENILKQVIKIALKNRVPFIVQFIDNKFDNHARESLLKSMDVYNEYLLMKGKAKVCSLCRTIGIEGPWNVESGEDILPEVSMSFYHILKRLPNGWVIWKMCTLRVDDKFYYKDPKFYCPPCSAKIQKWVKEYGDKIVRLFATSSYPWNEESLRKIGYKLCELGGRDLMVMAGYYAVYYIGSTREIDFAWKGICGWLP